MQIEEIKKDLDAFVKELFYGYSTLVTVNPNDPKMEYFAPLLHALGEEVKENGKGDNFFSALYEWVKDYRDNKLEEEEIRSLYDIIIRCRGFGIIIHNNDAISSLKMEKMTVENEIRQVLSEYEIQSAELKRYKEFVALQGKTLEAIK